MSTAPKPRDTTRSNKLKSGTNAVIMVIATIGLLFGINWLSTQQYGRYDMTEGQIHSLSDTSKEAIQAMDGLEIRVYLSKRYPKTLAVPGMREPLKNVPRYIQRFRDRLDEYQRNSNGLASLTIVQEDLDDQAAALELQPLTIPTDQADVDLSDDEPQRKYYIGLSLHYGRVEEVIPIVAQLEDFEYRLTKALIRLQDKQRDANVLRDLLDFGKEAHDAVDDCLKSIQRFQIKEEAEEEKEGGLGEQIQQLQTDRSSQVNEYLNNYATIDEKCSKVGQLVAQHRESRSKDENNGGARSISEEQLDALVDQIGWFDGMYGAWIASLVNAERNPNSFKHLETLLKHNEIAARASALRVVGNWLTPPAGQPGAQPLAGPLADRAPRAIQQKLTDQAPEVRALAVKLGVSINPAMASNLVEKALHDRESLVREAALDVALRSKVRVDPAQIRPFLSDPDFAVRQLAIVYLGFNKSATVAEFRPLLDDPDPRVRTQVGIELARMGDVESLDKIEALLGSIPAQDFRARQLLQQSLQELRAAAAPKKEGADEPTKSPQGGATPAPATARPRAPQPAGAAPGRRAATRSGLDRIGDVQLPDPLEGISMLQSLKEDISTKYNALKDSPGRKNIGILCGHEEFCPFSETGSILEKFPMIANLQNEPFAKRAVDDVTKLEQQLNQFNDVIRRFFMARGYRLIKVESGKPIENSVAALIVYGPRKPYSDLDLYYLDQFVLTGKPVVLFTNNYDVSVNQWDDKPPYNLVSNIKSTDTNLDAFLANYGVTNNKDLVMEPQRKNQAKIHTISAVRTTIGPLLNDAPYSYPLFPKFNQFSETHPLVSSLGETVLPFVSSFSADRAEEKGIQFEPLITSSDEAVAKSEGFVLDPRRLKDTIVAEKVTGPHHVAVQVSGDSVSSYFAGRDKPTLEVPETENGEEKPTEETPAKDDKRLDRGSVNLIIIGSNMGFECLNPSRIMGDFNPMTLMQDKIKGLAAAIPFVVRSSNIMARSFLGPQNPQHRQAQVATQLPGQQWDFRMESLEFLFNVFDWSTGSAGLAKLRSKQRKYSQRDV